jgi:hypothetical protein
MLGSKIRRLTRPAILALVLFAMWQELASGQSFELRLEHPRYSDIIKSEVPTIDLSGYERFFDGTKYVWVSTKVDFDVSDVQEVHVEAASPPLTEAINDLKRTNLELKGLTFLPPLSAISVTFTTEGSKRFSEFTRRFAKHKLAMILDGKLLMSATIYEQISGGKVLIQGIESEEERKTIVLRINELILLYQNSRVSQLQ